MSICRIVCTVLSLATVQGGCNCVLSHPVPLDDADFGEPATDVAEPDAEVDAGGSDGDVEVDLDGGADVEPDGPCTGGLTSCPAGVGLMCVDLTSDSNNCGACGASCPAGTGCTAGRCDCPPGQVRCAAVCVDVSRDPTNCGGCGIVCGAGLVCVGGSCREGVVRLDTGPNHTCALRASGTVLCWGVNWRGELGDGTLLNRNVPVSVVGLTDATQVAGEGGGVDGSATCAVRAGGGPVCWGYNFYGQLGDGTTTDSAVPVAVAGISEARQVAGGGWHTCAVDGAGRVLCWGDNAYGQLGDGTTTGSTTPATVVGIADAVHVETGLVHSCAVRATGAVACWGLNFGGRLGDGTTVDSSVPVPVVTITDAVQVGAGVGFTCALDASGSVHCWGDNAHGQLGDGTGAPSVTPVAVSGLTDAMQLACGFYHACAVRRSGQVACWGWDFYGMLGDGRPFTIGFEPVTVSGLTDALEVACGYWHTCAVRRSGAVMCWGNNAGGQLGEGTATDSYTPVEVSLP